MVLPFIKEYVIDPAVNAVAKWRLPFAVAVGSDVAKVLAAIGADCERNGLTRSPSTFGQRRMTVGSRNVNIDYTL